MAQPLQVSIEAFRANLAQFVGRVVYGHERIVVQRYNRDAVVVLSASEYERLIQANVDQTGNEKGRGEWQQVYEGLMKMRGIGAPDIIDGATTVNETLYGERGAWRGSQPDKP